MLAIKEFYSFTQILTSFFPVLRPLRLHLRRLHRLHLHLRSRCQTPFALRRKEALQRSRIQGFPSAQHLRDVHQRFTVDVVSRLLRRGSVGISAEGAHDGDSNHRHGQVQTRPKVLLHLYDALPRINRTACLPQLHHSLEYRVDVSWKSHGCVVGGLQKLQCGSDLLRRLYLEQRSSSGWRNSFREFELGLVKDRDLVFLDQSSFKPTDVPPISLP
jgi:hypothetical protein